MKMETCEEGRAANTKHSKELEYLRERLEEMKADCEKQKQEREAIAMELEETKRALTQERKEKEEMRKKQEELIEEHTRKTSEYEEKTKRLEEENKVLKGKRELEDDQTSDEESEEEDKDTGMKNGTRYEINQDMVNASTEESKNVFGIARKNGDIQQIISMIEDEHLDINGKEEGTQQTLLHIGAQTGNVELCKWLIEHGADVRARDKNENMAIHIAAYFGNGDVVDLLAQHDGETVNLKNFHGNTPLHCLMNGKDITMEKRMDAFMVLKKHGADTTMTNNKNETILQRAIVNEGLNKGYQYDQRIIDELVGDAKAHESSRGDHHGETPLYTAAFFGNKPILEALCGAHVSTSDGDEEGWQPLHAAASRGHDDCCRILLGNGADVNSENKIGITPALVASQNGHVEVLKVLVEFHADLNKSNNDGWRPIHSASARGHVDVVKYLISQGVELNVCEKQRHHSPLMVCILSREFKVEIMEALLGAGADWTLKSKFGKNCLHVCAENDNVEAAHVLVDYPNLKPPMDLNIRSTKGQTAIQLCTTKKSPKLAEFLSERLGIRNKPTIFSSGRRLQTNRLPDSAPAPATEEVPRETPQPLRRKSEEPKPASPPRTPTRPQSQGVSGNKTLSTSERKGAPTPPKKSPSPNRPYSRK